MPLHFSELNVPDPPCGIDPSPAAAKAYLRGTLKQLNDLHRRSTEWWRLSHRQQRVESAILGCCRHPPSNGLAANLGARYALGRRAINIFDAEQREHPQRPYALVTLISDRWITLDRSPTLRLGGIKAATRQVLRLGGFDGWLAVVEFQTLAERAGGFGHLVLPNVHAVAWTGHAEFSFEAAETMMAASGRLVSGTGAPTVTVKRRDDTSPTNLTAYMFKGACVAKYRDVRNDGPWGISLADCALPPRAAARQSELLSAMYLDELILAGGQGKSIRQELEQQLDASIRPRVGELSTQAAARFWEGASGRTPAVYGTVAVDRSTAQPNVAEALSLISGPADAARVSARDSYVIARR